MLSLLLSMTGALLGVLACAAWLPEAGHRLRRQVLQGGMALLLAMPVLLRLLDATRLTVDVPSPTAALEVDAAFALPSLTPFLIALWTAGSLLLLLRTWRRWVLMGRLVECARPLTTEEADWIQRTLGVPSAGQQAAASSPPIRIAPGLGTACVAVQGNQPVVLLPEEAFAWRRSTLRAVMSHEMEHFRRHDVWWRLGAEIALALWWWHPMAHLLVRRWVEACEQLCDDAVLRTGMRPRKYAQSLLNFASHVERAPAHVMAFGGGSPSRLRRRIASILRHRPHGVAMPSWLAWISIMALVAIIVAAITFRVRGERVEHQATLQTEARLRLDANPFPADP